MCTLAKSTSPCADVEQKHENQSSLLENVEKLQEHGEDRHPEIMLEQPSPSTELYDRPAVECDLVRSR